MLAPLKRLRLQTGFSLLEFAVVIGLAALLSGAVFSRSVDISHDARQAMIKSLATGLIESVNLIYIQAYFEGLTNAPQAIVVIKDDEIPVMWGYPTVYKDGRSLNKMISSSINFEEPHEHGIEIEQVDHLRTRIKSLKANNPENCYVEYKNPQSKLKPEQGLASPSTVIHDISGC